LASKYINIPEKRKLMRVQILYEKMGLWFTKYRGSVNKPAESCVSEYNILFLLGKYIFPSA
jgi:hypothetical protein